jgi:NAD(P)-dependent dehydrogenase (short-subunit alcohol dehydrogenase family)
MVRQEVAVVTGSSTGIGFETSLALARNGYHTYATVRKIDNRGSKRILDIAKNENLPLQVIQLDVDNDKSVLDAINIIKRQKGRIDIVINNAGYALVGPFEETSMEDIKAQLNQLFWCSKSHAGSNPSNERTKKRQNSQYNIHGRENCNSS